MSIIVCPPRSPVTLDPSWEVPHPGFGVTELSRNGQPIWHTFDGNGMPTVGALTEWCPVRQGVGWALEINGPMVREVYRLRKGQWLLTDRSAGFA